VASPDLSRGTGTPPAGWIERIHGYCASSDDDDYHDQTRALYIRLLSDLSLAVPEVFEAALAKLLAEGAKHRDDQRVYALAIAMARVFQQRNPTDEQVAWFLDDADAVVDDFDPAPEKWRVRKLPETRYDEFDCRLRINDVTYVIPAGGKEKSYPVPLATYRGWQKEADADARRHAEEAAR
jgi:hypothetical protein